MYACPGADKKVIALACVPIIESKIKNQPGQVLPPNLRQEGERSTVRKNGFVIFGPDAGGAPQQQSTSR